MMWRYLFVGYTAFIVLVLIGAYLGVIPTTIAVVPMYDSIGHFGLYGLWVLLLHMALNQKLFVGVPIAFLILFPIVALEEYAQAFATTRTFSLVDLAWGFAGMVVFLAVATLFHSRRVTQ